MRGEPRIKVTSVVVTVDSNAPSIDQACTVANRVTMSSDDVIALGKHIGDFQKSIATAFVFELSGVKFELLHE